MSNDDDDENEASEFRVVSPAEIFEEQRRVADQYHMEAEEFRRSVERFFDELPAEQMLTFHRMMLHAGHINDASIVHYWTGIAAVYLKKIHKVCTKCGDPHHVEDEHMLVEAATQQGEKKVSPKMPTESDETGPSGSGPSVEKLPDECLSDDELMVRYNLTPAVDATLMDAVCCKGCQAVFSSIEFRQSLGKTCPTCEAQKNFGFID